MFNSRVKQKYCVGKAIPFKDGLHLNKEGGPAAPISIEDARDWEITFRQGRAELLTVPLTSWEQDTDDNRKHLDLTKDRGGANTGTIPSAPNAPRDWLQSVNKDERITEENIQAMTTTYLSRLAMVLGKTALSFQDVIKIVKSFFPEIIMKFPKPPTYVWNPPSSGADKKDDKDAGTEDTEEDENTEKLKPQKIKDKLKVKLPQLTWTLRMSDGVETAELGFDDGSTAIFEIGAKANHLTITYTEPTRELPQVKVGDDDSDEEVADEDWRA